MEGCFISDPSYKTPINPQLSNLSPHSGTQKEGSLERERTFLQVEIQPNASLGPSDLFLQLLLQFLDLVHQPFVLPLHQVLVLFLQHLKLGFKLREIHVLGVRLLCVYSNGLSTYTQKGKERTKQKRHKPFLALL